MAQNDRSTGLVGNSAIKVPCRVASTANLVLYGEQTIDGVACVDGDRILVKNQNTGSENGIWVVDTGTWSRSKDFDGAYDVVEGSLVSVNNGATNSDTIWRVTTSGDIVPGTTSIAFERAVVNSTASVSFTNLGTGAIAETVSQTLQRVVHTDQYDTTPHYTAARNALTGTMGFASIDVAGDTTLGNAAGDTVTLNAGILTISSNIVATREAGAVAAGTSIALNHATNFSGNAAGTSDFAGVQFVITSSGSNNIAQTKAIHLPVQVSTASGTSTFVNGVEGYIRLSLNAAASGDITTARWMSGHIANESTGAAIASASVFYAGDTDLATGTGTIGDNHGVRIGNIGHASKITGVAASVRIGNSTGGAATTAGVYSEMSSGTNKYFLFHNASAPSMLVGNVRIGSNVSPSDKLEVVSGYTKLSGDTTFEGTGSYHEMRSANAAEIARISNKHASTPNGVIIKFSAAAPNDTTQYFLRCLDSSTDRLKIWSNGNVVNTNNSYGAISDAAVKDQINDARSQLDDFRALRFRNYKNKADLEQYGAAAREQLGLVAQEVLGVSPGLVLTIKREERQRGEVMIDGESYAYDSVREVPSYAIQYSVLGLKTARGLQENILRTDAHEQRIDAIEAALKKSNIL